MVALTLATGNESPNAVAGNGLIRSVQTSGIATDNKHRQSKSKQFDIGDTLARKLQPR